MADKTVYVDGTVGTGHYSTLRGALITEYGINPDLTSMAGILHVEISITTEDTTAVDFTEFAFTTSAAYYINIYTTAAARHAGVWSDSKYRLSTTNVHSVVIATSVRYIRFTGIQFKLTSNDTTAYRIIMMNSISGASDMRVDRCIFRGVIGSNTGSAATIGLYSSSANTAMTCSNSLFYGFLNGYGTPVGAGIVSDNGTCAVYNCTVTGCAIGLYSDSSSNITAKNVIAYNNTTDWSGSFNASSTYNLSKDATAPALGTYYRSKTLSFAGGSDYHLVSGDTDAIDKGTDLGSTYIADIDGVSRTGTWDLGADEYTATAQYARPASDVGLGGWKDESNGTTNIYTHIDETADAISDADYIKSGATPTDDTYTCTLGSITTPGEGTVKMRVRAKWL